MEEHRFRFNKKISTAMEDKKLTDTEIPDIKELLKYKAKVGCQHCDLIGKGCCSTCVNSLIKALIELFDSLQAENESLEIALTNTRDNLGDTRAELNKAEAEIERLKQIIEDKGGLILIETAKAEAYKEFAERVKEIAIQYSPEIDNLLKELVGEGE